VAGGQKDAHRVGTVFPAEQALEMRRCAAPRRSWQAGARVAGARQARRSHLVDARSPSMVPLHEFSLVPNLVYCASRNDVSTVVVDGHIVMQERGFPRLDEARIRDKNRSTARSSWPA